MRGSFNKPQEPKMSRQQAMTLWNSLSPEQKQQFNAMYQKLQGGELMLNHVGVDDNEQIQNIVLEPKDKPSAQTAPFMSHFAPDDEQKKIEIIT